MVGLLSSSLLLAAAAVLPPELLAWAKGWDIVDPGYVGVQLAWWLPDLGLRLLLLEQVGRRLGLGARRSSLPLTTLRSLAAEGRAALGLCVVALLALLPAALWTAALGLEDPLRRAGAIALALLAALPAGLYLLRRMLAPCVLLWEGGSHVQALQRSAALTQGARPLALILLSAGLGLACNQLFSLLPGPWDLLGACLGWLLQTAPLAWIYRQSRALLPL